MTDRWDLRCEWCAAKFAAPARRGPVPKFCCHAHYMRAYRARKAEDDGRLVEGQAAKAVERERYRCARVARSMGQRAVADAILTGA